ncbi:NTP transferase domain-containing protein [Emticicia sp. 17c]|uniref:NTP transferase domain-containing protein n=1 Tax=Emticicia sp. 17c TaxID=3127704 RepID=UPI00301DE48C
MNGLILMGGRSTRMGTDKSLLPYHDGLPQRDYLFALLKGFCTEVYFSAREGQFAHANVIPDKQAVSPMSGIVSAFAQHPDTPWLVVACDMPLVNEATLRTLLEYRHAAKVATAFYNPETKAPEPLITVYEPAAYLPMKASLEAGQKSPKIFLQEHDIEIIFGGDTRFMTNINTPQDFKTFINQQGG